MGFVGFIRLIGFKSYSLVFDLNYEQIAVKKWRDLVADFPLITRVTFALMSD